MRKEKNLLNISVHLSGAIIWKKTIKRVIKPNGKICTEQKEILFEVKEFYKKLFKNNDDSLTRPNLNNSNFKSNVRKLSASESNGIEGPLTINEIGESLKK